LADIGVIFIGSGSLVAVMGIALSINSSSDSIFGDAAATQAKDRVKIEENIIRYKSN
jgi:hypothetical protein